MKNLVTGATLDAESMLFLLGSVAKGKEAYDKLVMERLDCKSVKLFDKSPTTWKTKKMGKNWKPPDVNKETIHFLRMFHYSRLHNLGIADLLKHEIVSTSLYLTKDGELRKSPKSELARELKNLLEKPCPVEIPDSDLKSVVNSSLENKMKFQQSFIKWACCNCVSEVPIYLSGAGEENVTACIKVCWNDPSDDVDSLRNTLEEADDCKTLKVSSLLLVIQMYLFVQSTISIDGFIVV